MVVVLVFVLIHATEYVSIIALTHATKAAKVVKAHVKAHVDGDVRVYHINMIINEKNESERRDPVTS